MPTAAFAIRSNRSCVKAWSEEAGGRKQKQTAPMYRIISGSAHGLADTEAFIQLLQDLPEQRHAAVRTFLTPKRELIVSRAPGRLDLMGGIADYSGSLVLEFPIAAAAHVALQLDHEPKISIVSLGPEAPRAFAMALGDYLEKGKPISYEAARARFRAANSWAAY